MAGLKGRERSLTRTLSVGWKQRLALGCAVLHEPEIVFLDEPTGGVDPASRRRFWELINGLSERGVTVFVTTHYLDEAEYCNDIRLIHAGRIVAGGSPRRAQGSDHPQPHPRGRDRPGRRRHGDPAGQEPWVLETSIFGTSLHVSVADEAEGRRLIRDRLAAAGIAVRTASTGSCRRSRTSSSTRSRSRPGTGARRGSREDSAAPVVGPVIRKEFRQIRRRPRSLVFLLVLPAFLLIMFGFALNFDVKHIPLAVVDQDGQPPAATWPRDFRDDGVFRRQGDARPDRGRSTTSWREEKIRAALVIPATSPRTSWPGGSPSVQVIVDGANAMSATTAAGYVGDHRPELLAADDARALEERGRGRRDAPPRRPRSASGTTRSSGAPTSSCPGLMAFILMVIVVDLDGLLHRPGEGAGDHGTDRRLAPAAVGAHRRQDSFPTSSSPSSRPISVLLLG